MLPVKPLFLVIFVILGSVLTHQKFPFALPNHFGKAVDSGCEVQSLEKEQINLPTINNCFQVSNASSLNCAITLDKSKIFKSLSLSKSLEKVNLSNRSSSTQGESTSEQLTQSGDYQRFQFDEEMNTLMQDLDNQKLRINPSPRSGDILDELSQELKFSDFDQALLDLFGSTSQKNDIVYQKNCQFDFTAGHFIPERFRTLA